MKLAHCISRWLALFTLLACQRSNLFEPAEESAIRNPIFGPSGEVTIAIEVSGSHTEHYRAWCVETNGFIKYVDALQFDGQATAALTQQELSSLVALFLEKDFLHLQDSYESALTPSRLRYRVVFNHGGMQKIVHTDSVSAPASLQEILQRLTQQMAALRDKTLLLSLIADRDTLVQGQEAKFTFTVTNPHAHTVALVSGDQLADFFVAASQPVFDSELGGSYAPPYLWQAVEKTTSIRTVNVTNLPAGKSLVFQASWNGRSNNGVLLEGDFRVAARCATIPGGYSAWLPLRIIKGS
ncbi:hypothetical protein HUU05_25295 [candidate division KSB1 bacterium]|nr:hypothetical protein [candidate division KSB1 bacterium]